MKKLDTKLTVCLMMALFFVFVSLCSAADIYISKSTGSNKNPGTKESPKKLLWKVMNKMAEGDHLFVAEGTYYGKGKTGLMPRITVNNVIIEGGWKADFSGRNPFKYLTIIGTKPDLQGESGSVFHGEIPSTKLSGVTIDGFCIDRGQANIYHSDGEPGANKSIEGHVKDSCWGYQAINRKMSGSNPTVMLLGRGHFTVRNMVLVNNPWWGIYIKGGGKEKITIENNLILISQGRGIEAITGGGWGTPTWVIKNNTILFNHSLKSTEGRALSADPRKGYGKYIVENNIFAFSDGGGITIKFPLKGDELALNHNKFFFNRRGDICVGGSGLANADEFEDELEIDTEGNIHKIPGSLGKADKAWFDRYSMREYVNMLAGKFNKWEELAAARGVFGLKEYHIPGYDKTFGTYKELPKKRNNYDMSRYPRPMKKEKLIDWKKSVLPLIGADPKYGIKPYSK